MVSFIQQSASWERLDPWASEFGQSCPGHSAGLKFPLSVPSFSKAHYVLLRMYSYSQISGKQEKPWFLSFLKSED